MTQHHAYHLVKVSPWPIISALSVLNLMLMLLSSALKVSLVDLILSSSVLVFSMAMWWLDIFKEANLEGAHCNQVILGLKFGMVLFIVSELFFFISFFWSFFQFSLAPDSELGMAWPLSIMEPFNPLQTPLLNTILLVCSGLTVTAAHHALLVGQSYLFELSLGLTVMLGVMFSWCQHLEFSFAPFTLYGSCFGTVFFTGTGFHGIHVLLGTMYLFVSLLKGATQSMSNNLSFEFAVWYWHFVDLIWLFLYSFFYWWSI